MNNTGINNYILFIIDKYLSIDDECKNKLLQNPTILDGVLYEPIGSIEWSARVSNVFKKNGIIKIRDIIFILDKFNMSRYRNCGQISCKEIKDKLVLFLSKYIKDFSNKEIDEGIGIQKNELSLLFKGVLGQICQKHIDKLVKIINSNEKLDKLLNSSIDFTSWPVRCQNIFNEIGIKKVGDFSNIRIEELMSMRNMGKITITEMLDELEKHIIRFVSFETKCDNNENISYESKLDKMFLESSNYKKYFRGVIGSIFRNKLDRIVRIITDDSKLNELCNTSINFTSWSTRSENILNKVGVQKIGDFINVSIEDLMQQKNSGKKTSTEIVNKLDNYIEYFLDVEEGIKQNNCIVISDDLVGLVNYMMSKLTIKKRKILSYRYGLWDGERKTLEKIGKQFRITRERVRQIQKGSIKILKELSWIELLNNKCIENYKGNKLDIFINEFFKTKLIPYFESHYNIANKSELIQIIYSIDDENTEVDIAYEFISDIFYDGKFIFDKYLIEFDNNVVGLNVNDKEIYLRIINVATDYLTQKGVPQDIEKIIEHIGEIKLINGNEEERKKVNRFLSVSNIPKDRDGRFGLRAWNFFNPSNIPSMIERALMEIGEPSHYTQITMLMNEMFPESGPFNTKNVHSRIGSIRNVFVWFSPGVYGLKRWGIKRPPSVMDYLIELLRINDKPLHLNELTEKILEKCNCTRTSVGMTLLLKKDVFIKYSDNYYGLIEWK